MTGPYPVEISKIVDKRAYVIDVNAHAYGRLWNARVVTTARSAGDVLPYLYSKALVRLAAIHRPIEKSIARHYAKVAK